MEDEKFKMIPTKYRSKIPHSLSYATGARIVSLAWQNVPQFKHLTLAFSCYHIANALRPQSRPREILAVSYRNLRANQFSPRSLEGMFYGSRWDVHVKVCRHEDAHEVRQWLENVGLEKARAWLNETGPHHGESGGVHWRALFDEEERTFSVESGGRGFSRA